MVISLALAELAEFEDLIQDDSVDVDEHDEVTEGACLRTTALGSVGTELAELKSSMVAGTFLSLC